MSLQSDLSTEREQHANARRDLEHARSIIQPAAGARRELEGAFLLLHPPPSSSPVVHAHTHERILIRRLLPPGLFRRERVALERASRERVAKAEDSAALQAEEMLSQESELLLLQRKAQDQEKGVMQLEIDRLSRVVFELRAEKELSEAEAEHLRTELKRAAAERVARDRKRVL